MSDTKRGAYKLFSYKSKRRDNSLMVLGKYVAIHLSDMIFKEHALGFVAVFQETTCGKTCFKIHRVSSEFNFVYYQICQKN